MTLEGDGEALADAALAAWEQNEFSLAEALWRQAADLGSARAMVNLGRNLIDEQDLDGAAAWFLRAVDAGSSEGAEWMWRMAVDRGDEVEQEVWVWRAANLGDASWLLHLAHREPDPDPDESFNVALMRRAAEAGSFLARGNLSARAFQRGSYEECVTWGEQALALHDQEDDPAQVARLHGIVGIAYQMTGRPARALTHLEAALALASNTVPADSGFIAELQRQIDLSPLHAVPAPSAESRSAPSPAFMWTRPKPTPSASSSSRFCTQCGAARDEGARFCGQCGSEYLHPQGAAVSKRQDAANRIHED